VVEVEWVGWEAKDDEESRFICSFQGLKMIGVYPFLGVVRSDGM